MKLNPSLLLLLSIALNACINADNKQHASSTEKDSLSGVVTKDTTNTPTKETQYELALTGNAIQVVNAENGSTKAINFGTPFEQVLTTVENVLKTSPTVKINSECGSGPLKFATWSNGLTLLFQEKDSKWLFVGWAANQSKTSSKLSTMAGVGIGSTRKEMESAYVIKVSKTTLGVEFATKTDDLFGIFDGPTQDAKITNLWSGVSCNFR